MRYICVHGHFYQPPRENPWLEAIERQESASPYHDWNARINAECYAPNAASRILDGKGRIVRIVNNYSKISFNFGATLLDWMKPNAPDTYEAILEADRRSLERFGGHGSAIAQGYGHIILPLANTRDKRTQVRWGIRDFEARFHRKPEGMWLAETAVDVEGLEIMAEEGLLYTILAPHQAGTVRPQGREEWQDVTGARIDPSRTYRVPLPSGRTITVFFYDGPISRAVAFEQLLENGERFAERLMNAFPDEARAAPLGHIATDGETYGHHHRHGEMALSYALQQFEEHQEIELTNYGAYLERHPPEWEAQIIEDTSWSCVHGIERWRSDCGCNTGAPGLNQAWRGPLRDALDWLRDEVTPHFEAAAAELFDDPWEARDRYIEVILDRSAESIDRFFREAGRGPLDDDERIRGLKLMELQRQAMMMYTSCGWFFDELSGIETVQVIQYAGRAVQLAEDLFDHPVEDGFLDRLEEAKSNLPGPRDGRRIYHTAVEPARVDLAKVGAHYAVSSLFEEYERDDRIRIYGYLVEPEEDHDLESGRTRLALGSARVTSVITRESGTFSFAVLHLGDHNVIGGVRPYRGPESYDHLVQDLTASFTRADYPAVIRILDRSFRAATYSLRSLFRDEQHRILARILDASISEAERTYASIYEGRAPLMRFVADLDLPQPKAFRMAAEYVLNHRIETLLSGEMNDLDKLRDAIEEARLAAIPLDPLHLGFAAREALERVMLRFVHEPDRMDCLRHVDEGVALIGSLPFEVNPWGVQNMYYRMLQDEFPDRRARAEQGDGAAAEWVERFRKLGERIAVAPR